MLMDMNFPHLKRRSCGPNRNGNFAVLVATAVARQMTGVTIRSVTGSKNMVAALNDPVSARIKYFASAANIGVAGSFLPFAAADSAKVNKLNAGVYPDALANGKPCLLTDATPYKTVNMRGMENRG